LRLPSDFLGMLAGLTLALVTLNFFSPGVLIPPPRLCRSDVAALFASLPFPFCAALPFFFPAVFPSPRATTLIALPPVVPSRTPLALFLCLFRDFHAFPPDQPKQRFFLFQFAFAARISFFAPFTLVTYSRSRRPSLTTYNHALQLPIGNSRVTSPYQIAEVSGAALLRFFSLFIFFHNFASGFASLGNPRFPT